MNELDGDQLNGDQPDDDRQNKERDLRKQRRLVHLTLAVAGLLLLGVAVPGLLRARITSNETSAIGTMRTLSGSQACFTSAAIVDLDGDGTGEFGFIAELGGTANYRVPGGELSTPTAPAFITSVLGTSALANGGIATKSGYCFLYYLPSAKGPAIKDPGRPMEAKGVSPNASEVRFAVYAWPMEHGVSGRRAFVATQQGEVFASENAEGRYNGLDSIPPPGAALVASSSEEANNLGGSLVTGTLALDGQLWMPAGN